LPKCRWWGCLARWAMHCSSSSPTYSTWFIWYLSWHIGVALD
jgi:hypothetical protein